MNRTPTAVLGATGLVGQRFMEALADHPVFAPPALVGSEASQGMRYRDRTDWMLSSPAPPSTDETLVGLSEVPPGATVFSALPGGVAGPIEADLRAAGHTIFTNARDHRMDPDVPLLIPEVNARHIRLVDAQPGPGAIIANGNCSGIIMTLALAPLARAFGIESVDVTTMQARSGAGKKGLAMDLRGNVLPHIAGEEDKLQTEPLKVLDADFPIRATCTRVDVMDGHFESLHVRLAEAVDAATIGATFASFRGPPEVAGLPSAPRRPIHVLEGDRPQPALDVGLENGMAVSVGRIRVSDDGRHVRFVVLGDNTRRGAAGQSVLNAEYAHAQRLLETTRVA